MNLINNLTAKLPFLKKEENLEYYFVLNIATEEISAAVWTIEGNRLNIISCADVVYSSTDDLLQSTDKVLDLALGNFVAEPDKILFGVPDLWVSEDNLKEQYLNVLRKIVKELDLRPMAYVSTTQALSRFLENLEGAPTTAILIGLEKNNVTVSVIRAGKLNGTKILSKGENLGIDIEKGLLSFSGIEVLPSKILIYGKGDLEKIKSELLSFSWMQKLSFLHFPKISNLEEMVAVKAVCFAGAIELNPHVKYYSQTVAKTVNKKVNSLMDEPITEKDKDKKQPKELIQGKSGLTDFGFVAGDITAKSVNPEAIKKEEIEVEEDKSVGISRPIVRSLRFRGVLFVPVIVLALLLAAYLFFYKATVIVYLEPKILEKSSTVVADPNIKSVDEAGSKIPGQIIEVTVSGSGKGSASGKKQIGDSAKGTVKIINNSNNQQTFSKGSVISANGNKFTFDSTVSVASTSATVDSKSTAKVAVIASVIGADGNVPSGTEFSSGNSQVAIVAEGNFSGGTSKEVTTVSDDDQKKLLAATSSELRNKAQQQLQEKLEGKKILAESLQEDITKRTFNKNVGDQANEFTLNLTAKYKGTAYSDEDLRVIVSKLVATNIPDDFQLNLSETETQAEVSKVEKDGKLVFLAKFKAKLMPKVDENKIKQQIRGQSLSKTAEILKGFDNVLDSEIRTNLPFLPTVLQRIPLLAQNINIQTGLK